MLCVYSYIQSCNPHTTLSFYRQGNRHRKAESLSQEPKAGKCYVVFLTPKALLLLPLCPHVLVSDDENASLKMSTHVFTSTMFGVNNLYGYSMFVCVVARL